MDSFADVILYIIAHYSTHWDRTSKEISGLQMPMKILLEIPIGMLNLLIPREEGCKVF